jgi:hypothetical protein
LKGRAFLTSCEIYTSLTALDFPDDQTQIHWALSYCKSGRAVNFAERIIRQEMKTGKMVFSSWTDFTDEFESIFCPENEATTALMTLESDRYFQGKRNVDAYTDEFRKLIALSGYMDPIAIVLKFRRGLQPSTQDKITESGTDHPKDNDLQGWFQAARRFNLNRLANEAFCYTSRRPATATTTTYPARPAFSFLQQNAPMPTILAAMPTPARVPPQSMSKAGIESCYQCHQSGHISSNCPLRYDIHHMTSDEQDDMIEKLLADRDAAMAATAASTQSEEATIIECEVSEEDFIRCSW